MFAADVRFPLVLGGSCVLSGNGDGSLLLTDEPSYFAVNVTYDMCATSGSVLNATVDSSDLRALGLRLFNTSVVVRARTRTLEELMLPAAPVEPPFANTVQPPPSASSPPPPPPPGAADFGALVWEVEANAPSITFDVLSHDYGSSSAAVATPGAFASFRADTINGFTDAVVGFGAYFADANATLTAVAQFRGVSQPRQPTLTARARSPKFK